MSSGELSVNRQAREVACQGSPSWSASDWPVVEYASEGNILVFGPSERVLPVLEHLAGRARGVALVMGISAGSVSAYSGFEVLNARATRVEGYLGRFRAWAEGESGVAVDLAVMSPRRDGYYDVVLDLGERPAVESALRPPGYIFSPRANINASDLAEHLIRYRGRFTKPRYVRFMPEACVHVRQGVAGCDSCLDACPAGAIALEGDAVSITYALCQGCGTCAQVCPSGAITFGAPDGDRLNAEVKSLLDRYREAGGTEPFILFHDGRGTEDALLPYLEWESPTAIPLALHSVGQSSLENWFGALAHGAVGVGILATSDDEPRSAVLEEQVTLAKALSAAIGLAGRPIRLLGAGDADKPCGPWMPKSGHDAIGAAAGARTKGARLGPLLDLLSTEVSKAGPIPLPEGAPFGTVQLDSNRCTLCGACVNLCPEDALELTGQGRALSFTEASCVQCGICAKGCPEGAIALEPRWMRDGVARGQPRVLHEADEDGMAHCAVCGRPFLPKAILQAALGRVATAESLRGTKRELLECCPACRAEATMREQFIRVSPS